MQVLLPHSSWEIILGKSAVSMGFGDWLNVEVEIEDFHIHLANSHTFFFLFALGGE